MVLYACRSLFEGVFRSTHGIGILVVASSVPSTLTYALYKMAFVTSLDPNTRSIAILTPPPPLGESPGNSSRIHPIINFDSEVFRSFVFPHLQGQTLELQTTDILSSCTLDLQGSYLTQRY
jgi:hypothetical protein